MSQDIDAAQFDVLNSDEVIVKGVRELKKFLEGRKEKVEAFKSKNDLPKDKDLKPLVDDAASRKLLDAVVAYWQDEAFKKGYLQAVSDVKTMIGHLGI